MTNTITEEQSKRIFNTVKSMFERRYEYIGEGNGDELVKNLINYGLDLASANLYLCNNMCNLKDDHYVSEDYMAENCIALKGEDLIVKIIAYTIFGSLRDSDGYNLDEYKEDIKNRFDDYARMATQDALSRALNLDFLLKDPSKLKYSERTKLLKIYQSFDDISDEDKKKMAKEIDGVRWRFNMDSDSEIIMSEDPLYIFGLK